MKLSRFSTLLLLLIPFVSFSQVDEEVVARVIIVGDGGELTNGKHPVADAISKHVTVADDKTTILFIGDNIYRHGLPDEEEDVYSAKEDVLRKQVSPFFDHKANVYVVPGNHDWANGANVGWTNIKRQGNWITNLQKKNIHFLPMDGCPGPNEVNIDDSTLLVIMDSQWWLHPNDKPEENSDCECKTEGEVVVALQDIAYRNRDKRIIFASHHPFRSHGIHGGYYTFKQHIFPITDVYDKAYFPLPIIGSIYPIVRGEFGNIQDLMHPIYKHMISEVEDAFKGVPNVTFVAGHEHNLQLIEDKGWNYIVSGSGSKTERVKDNTLFAAVKNGFAEILYLKDGKQKIVFYEVDTDKTIKKLYEKDIVYKQRSIAKQHSPSAPTNVITTDSVYAAIAPEYDSVGRFHRFMFGEHYRKIWATPVKMKVFRVTEEHGGLTVIKRGGGQQTKSLRLQDEDGKQWVLRTVQKDPVKALPSNLKSTVAKPIVQDQISAANPYAPVTVPDLATAIGVPHANPQIVYVPDDTALGIYRHDFANTVCLFEEREPVSDGKTYSTFSVLDKLEDDNDNIIDERAVLRARMLDLLIGDWDRHEDQWRWEKRKEGERNIYSPIPRDRDQVYFISTGVIPYIAGRNWVMPKFQGFDKRIKNVNGFMFNARHFDRYFLNSLDESVWEEVIKDIQAKLTDEVIDNALLNLPDTIYSQIGKRIATDLKARRNSLMRQGLKYYRFLSKSVDVPASDKEDKFVVVYLPNGDVKVEVRKINKKGELEHITYSRVLDHTITNEVCLYGRGGKDVFNISGVKQSKIRVRMIGGGKHDQFNIADSVRNKRKIYVYDRSDKKNDLPNSDKARIKTSDKNSINDYNGKAFQYDKLMPLVTGGYNLDDGILLGGGVMYMKQGFRKDPYAAKHSFLFGRAFATDAGFINYKGDMVDLLGKFDLNVTFNYRAPDNTANFFGLGNETEFVKFSDPVIKYYRARYNFSDAHVSLKYALHKHIDAFVGVIGQYYNVDDREDNEGRYIELYRAQTTSNDVYSQRWFSGAYTGFEIDTRNSKIVPVRGMHWLTTLTGVQQINGAGITYGQLKSELSVLLSFSRYPKIVIGNRVGAGVTIGDMPNYFQMYYIGGQGSLMGYRKNRFAGNAMLYNNFELRVKLFDFASYLFPGSVGLIGFNDIGRVWLKNENSQKWHAGYGGGIFVIPAETIVVNGVLGYSEEGLLPYISLGFRF